MKNSIKSGDNERFVTILYKNSSFENKNNIFSIKLN